MIIAVIKGEGMAVVSVAAVMSTASCAEEEERS